jgi:small subunit ribosomal protein S3
MGQKINPIGLRLGIIRGWESNWYGGKNFGQKLVEDDKIRKYLFVRLAHAQISRIYIERTLKLITVTINSARPGRVIGAQGQDAERLKEELKKITGKDIQINIAEIKRPEIDARLVAQSIASQIEGRQFYRKTIKNTIIYTMKAGAEGIKVSLSGRIGGVEIARSENFKEGRTPLHTLRADIDYCHAEAHTTYGRIGVKVWICKGLIYGKPDFFIASSEGAPSGPGSYRPHDRQGGYGNRQGGYRDRQGGGGYRGRDRRDGDDRRTGDGYRRNDDGYRRNDDNRRDDRNDRQGGGGYRGGGYRNNRNGNNNNGGGFRRNDDKDRQK